MLQFHLWTKTPSNMEQKGGKRSEGGKGREGEKAGMKGEGEGDKENIEGEREGE